MRITSKGQVTIPKEIRNRLGLMPSTEVEFEVVGNCARIRKVYVTCGASPHRRSAILALRSTAETGMSTDEIMALTRCDEKGGEERE